MASEPFKPRVRVSVLAAEASAGVHARARALADELGLSCIAFDAATTEDPTDLILAVTSERLELRENTERRSRPLFVDFTCGKLDRRRQTGLAKDQPLARALGLRKGISFVVDATAGFLGDAFHLASLGCFVVAIERCGVMARLASDGLLRGMRSGTSDLTNILRRLRLVQGDARELLGGSSLRFRPDAVFLDPMYTSDDRTALSRKDLRIARELVGDDSDARELFQVACRAARKRVVVKRHPAAPPLFEPVPVQFHARTVRYDVYLRDDPLSRS